MNRRMLAILAAATMAGAAWAQDNVIGDPAQVVGERPQAVDTAKAKPDQAKPDIGQVRIDAATTAATSSVCATQFATNPNPVFTSVTRMKVEAVRKDGKSGADVTCSITLINVANIPFTFEAVLVDANGKVHTNARGVPYSASREVSTGDEEDTDRYTVWLSCAGLFSSRPPAELYMQARLIDAAGKIVATSMPQLFRAPRD